MPVAPGFTPIRYGQPNPDTPGTFGPLGRPPNLRDVVGNTRQLNALIADLKKHYPGIGITSEYRSPEVQAGLRKRAEMVHGADAARWVGAPGGSSHNWGTGVDAAVSPRMWEQFKRDMRVRGLRAYDEGEHIHIDDRTDLPDGPSEKKRRK